MIPVNWNQSDKKDWKGVTIRGMQFAMLINHLTANTAFTANPVDLSLIKVKLRYYKKRSRTWHVIFDDALLPLILHSGFFDGCYQQNLQIGTFVANVYVAAAMSVDEQLLLNSYIKFDRCINCEEGDTLSFDVQVPNGALAATADPAASTFYYDILEGIGLGDSVPVIQCEAVRASVSSDKYSAGEGVQSLSFINTDKAGVTSAVQVISTTMLEGDKLADSDDFFDILSKRNDMFEDLAQSNVRNQSFRLFDMRLSNMSLMPTRMDRVNVSMSFIAANVNAGKNWYVTSRLVNDSGVYSYYLEKIGGQVEQNANAPAK